MVQPERNGPVVAVDPGIVANSTCSPLPLQLTAASNERGAEVALRIAGHLCGSALMAQGSTIEWTESTWNPVTGCTKISPGCKHCYAERMAMRLQAMGQPNYDHGFRVSLQKHMLFKLPSYADTYVIS
jgi:hypothetical protein